MPKSAGRALGQSIVDEADPGAGSVQKVDGSDKCNGKIPNLAHKEGTLVLEGLSASRLGVSEPANIDGRTARGKCWHPCRPCVDIQCGGMR